jgi:hypothetical protein
LRLRLGTGKQAGNLTEFGASTAYCGGDLVAGFPAGFFGKRQIGLGVGLANVTKGVSGARERIALAIDQTLDLERDLNITSTVKALAGSTFIGFQLGELRFPKTKHVSFNFADTGNIPDLEVETVRDCGCFNGALRGRMRCHS